MEIKFDFSGLWAQAKRIGAERVETIDWTAATQLDPVDIELLQGREVLTAVDSRTNPASTAGTAQHDLDLVSG